MPRWTSEQEDAIYSDGSNIIVSAGAGSGKTAVLTERVITKLKNKIRVDELLVLTFTNAAASEMKERVRKAITKHEELHDALDIIDASYITTFDSFALSVVRKYHYLLGITKEVGIIDGSLIELKKQLFLDAIMEEEYKRQEPDFSKLITDFVLKDDSNITSMILDLYRKIDLIYKNEEYLDTYINKYYQEEYINNAIGEYLLLIDKTKDRIDFLNTMITSEIDEKYEEKLQLVLRPILESNTYEDIKNSILSRLPNLPRDSSIEAKEYKQEISTCIKRLKELCCYENEEAIIKSILSTRNYIQAIIRIIKKLDSMLVDYKKTYDLYEFTDIAKMAIRLVKDFPEVKEELRDSFHEILVDEYQDTSDLQELFIEAISNENVYMVGDIKQSIYRFRNANPDIFKGKYDAYQKHVGGKKIDLNKNFRSRNTVLENINHIFNQVMDTTIGGAAYVESHQLVFGNTSYVERGTTQQNMDMELYDYQVEDDNPFKKEEIEAFIIAKDIKEKIESKYQIFDKDENRLRDITYGDFAILIDQKKHFELYKQIFTYFQIPLELNKESVLTESTLMILIKNIFIMLSSSKIDAEYLHAYASIARSPLFEYSDTDLFLKITKRNFKDDIVTQKIKKIKSTLNSETSASLLENIIEEFDFYETIIKLGNVEENLYRLEYLLKMADNLSMLGYHVYQFMDYMKEIFDSSLSVKYDSKLGGGDAVKIMSIHKSKGLEFYICYFPELSQKWVMRDMKDRFTYDFQYGIVTPYYDKGIKRTIYSELLKENYLKETISEKLRVFYVALTRAKEKMILLCDLSKQGETGFQEIVSSQTRMEYRSFQDVLLSIKDSIQEYITPYDLTKLNLTRDYQIASNTVDMDQEQADSLTIKELDIKQEIVKNEVFSHKRNNLKSYEETMIIETGNYMHEVLESIEFGNINLSQLPIRDEVKERVLTFINIPLLNNIEDADIYQEYEFIYEENNKKRHGIIDLMLIYEDHVDIIDYKLRNIDRSDYEIQLEGYKKYIHMVTDLPVRVYLYSILNGEVREINRSDDDAIETQ